MRGRFFACLALASSLGIALPALAFGHAERPSYWPDPDPEMVDGVPAGGEVPEPRSLASALDPEPVGKTRVVCRDNSLNLALRSINAAEQDGFKLRPSLPREKLSEQRADNLRDINRRLANRCKFDSIQQAIFKSGNNDRVVVMPGRYPEPQSRSQPTNDPTCADMLVDGSPSYEYQSTCPNDQNLVYVQGREIGEDPPDPPLSDRHGIPDNAPCLKCNLQLEGSGARPEDVVIDAAQVGASRAPRAKPGPYVKDVVMRVDRGDGFVGRNFTVKGAIEHGAYVEETDGYLLDRVKMFWNADYGNLSFAADHGMIRNCEALGAGDAGVYPGSAAETGEQAVESFYPDAPRINQVIKRCDLHHNTLGYSGSMGNAVRITRNDVYDNTTGIVTDTISAGGHPGYPQDSLVVDHNRIYSNNLNLYTENPDVEPTVGVPVGVGFLIAGGNSNKVHHNWIFDNWRRGTMLLGVPDAIVTPEGDVEDGVACENPAQTNSCNNRYYDNTMGIAPAGFAGKAETPMPNGTDFWWDEFPGNTRNCWFDNVGSDGTRDSLTADPPINPVPGNSLPGFLPEDCPSSVGAGDPVKEAILADCSMWMRGNTADDHPACDWFTSPPEPESAEAAAEAREQRRVARRYERTAGAAEICEALSLESGGVETCGGSFADRP